jgi:hypothetical protein
VNGSVMGDDPLEYPEFRALAIVAECHLVGFDVVTTGDGLPRPGRCEEAHGAPLEWAREKNIRLDLIDEAIR